MHSTLPTPFPFKAVSVMAFIAPSFATPVSPLDHRRHFHTALYITAVPCYSRKSCGPRMSANIPPQSSPSNSSAKTPSTKEAEESTFDTTSASVVTTDSEFTTTDSGSDLGSSGGGGDGDGDGDSDGGGGGGGGQNGDGSEGSADDDGSSSSDDASLSAFSNARSAAKTAEETVKTSFQFLSDKAKATLGKVSNTASGILKVVPAPVMVALISLVSTITGARLKAARDLEAAERSRMDAARKKKSAIEKELRDMYQRLAGPMLKSAAKLAERLYVLVDAEWDSMEGKDGRHYLGPSYTAYLLGRYLATVETIKQRSALLDYGFPAADRILANILGRLQGVLSANDRILDKMQRTEHFFKPPPGEEPLKGGPLKITPRTQTVLGDLLLRRLWVSKYDFIQRYDEDQMVCGAKSMVTFLEFMQLLEKDALMRRWFDPVIYDFERIEYAVQTRSPKKRRCNQIGARVYFLQSALVDLIEFFDPLPHPQFLPYYRRERLQLGNMRHNEGQRAPQSIYRLYRELANIRDHRVLDGRTDRLRVSNGVEVFVKGVAGLGDSEIAREERGDCPFSQRVLMTLREMGIPYSTVTIRPDAKPAWYYLLHAENITPTLYYDGEVVDESGMIVAYLREKFPHAKKLASANDLKLAVGTAALTKFHDHFVDWCDGDESAREKVEYELGRLNDTIAYAQEKKEGAFLGGERFSREDTALVPVLNNVVVAGEGLKSWFLAPKWTALRRYLDEARKVESFAKVRPADCVVIHGYREIKLEREMSGRGGLANLLE